MKHPSSVIIVTSLLNKRVSTNCYIKKIPYMNMGLFEKLFAYIHIAIELY